LTDLHEIREQILRVKGSENVSQTCIYVYIW
jgi:hypothetical protein